MTSRWRTTGGGGGGGGPGAPAPGRGGGWARAGGDPARSGPPAREAMATARADFIRLLESDRTQFIYGVTSSMGPRAKVTIPPEQQGAHARAFEFRGNGARGFGGGYLDERVVRGIIFARLANFVAGNSKAGPVIAERLAAPPHRPPPPGALEGGGGCGG